MTPNNPTGGEWEKAALINLAKRYATACYLVEEESHDEELRTNALTELIDYVSYLLSSAHADGVKEGREAGYELRDKEYGATLKEVIENSKKEGYKQAVRDALEKVDRKSEKYSPTRTARHALEELVIEITALTPEEPTKEEDEECEMDWCDPCGIEFCVLHCHHKCHTPEEPIQDNYERDHSHLHCWEQGKSPACGMKGEHKICCLCGIMKATGKSGL